MFFLIFLRFKVVRAAVAAFRIGREVFWLAMRKENAPVDAPPNVDGLDPEVRAEIEKIWPAEEKHAGMSAEEKSCSCRWVEQILNAGTDWEVSFSKREEWDSNCPVHGEPECTCIWGSRFGNAFISSWDQRCPVHGGEKEKGEE